MPCMALGLLLMIALPPAPARSTAALIRYGKFTAVAATLATYIALQGCQLPAARRARRATSRPVTDVITDQGRARCRWRSSCWSSRPSRGVRCCVTARWGLRLRAVGSDEESARRVGVPINRTVILGYVAVSLFVFLGAVVLLAQLGIGDPAQGVGYTLSSITAVVLGGTSLLGGRGTFVGTLLGAGLIVQVLNATVFLEPHADLAVLLPGRPDRGRRHHLQPGARQTRATDARRLAHSRRGGEARASSAVPRQGRHPRRGRRRARDPRADEVLVEVLYCGICGTDLHEYWSGRSSPR